MGVCLERRCKVQTENKIFTDEEILKFLNNIKDIIQTQKELNHIVDKRLKALEKFTLERK